MFSWVVAHAHRAVASAFLILTVPLDVGRWRLSVIGARSCFGKGNLEEPECFLHICRAGAHILQRRV